MCLVSLSDVNLHLHPLLSISHIKAELKPRVKTKKWLWGSKRRVNTSGNSQKERETISCFTQWKQKSSADGCTLGSPAKHTSSPQTCYLHTHPSASWCHVLCLPQCDGTDLTAKIQELKFQCIVFLNIPRSVNRCQVGLPLYLLQFLFLGISNTTFECITISLNCDNSRFHLSFRSIVTTRPCNSPVRVCNEMNVKWVGSFWTAPEFHTETLEQLIQILPHQQLHHLPG